MQVAITTQHNAFDLQALEQALDDSLLPCSLLQLPLDVIRIIIRCLDGYSILSLSNSCRRFRELVQSDAKLLNLLARKLYLPVRENDSPEKVHLLLHFFKAADNLERYFFEVRSTNPPSIFIHIADYQEVREKMKIRAIELESNFGPCPLFEKLKKPMRSIEMEQRIAAKALANLPPQSYITLEQLKENSLYTLYKGEDTQTGCIKYARQDQAISHIAKTMREYQAIRIKKRRSPEPPT